MSTTFTSLPGLEVANASDAAEATTFSAVRQVEIWAFNAAWWRIEWKDDRGESLGFVSFERRLPEASQPRRIPRPFQTGVSMGQIIGWLQETLSFRLFAN